MSRTRSPPSVTATWRSTASLPSVAWCVLTCTASSAQSAIETTVSRARVADDEFDVVGVGSAAALVDDDDGLGQLADPHLQMPVGRRALTGPGDGDLDRIAELRCPCRR